MGRAWDFWPCAHIAKMKHRNFMGKNISHCFDTSGSTIEKNR
jgi:hypothetical protein